MVEVTLVELPYQNMLQQRDVHDSCVVWADKNANVEDMSHENGMYRLRLDNMRDTRKEWLNIAYCECIETTIEQLKSAMRNVLIVSGGFARSILPKISEMKKFDNLYGIIVFCREDEDFLNKWADKYREVYPIVVSTDFVKVINETQQMIEKARTLQ